MGVLKRVPSFSQRPGFPSGLRVLLVDDDSAARCSTETLLKECSYSVRLEREEGCLFVGVFVCSV